MILSENSKIHQALIDTTKTLLNEYFRINGERAGDKASEGQIAIVASIVFHHHISPRGACVAPTGYGKSEYVSMGVILRVYLYHEPFIIASVKFDTAEIIMKKVIEHIFDNDNLIAELEIDTTKHLSQLKRERNKQAINFKSGGGIRVISLHGTDSDVSTAIGQHVPNLILDESPLLSPSKYLSVLKILEGTGDYNTTFLFELGNAVNRNHFMYNVKINSKYLKHDISLQQAIDEKRMDVKSIDEKRGLPFFDQFYECKFPEEDEIDSHGYKQLLTTTDIDAIMVGAAEINNDPQTLGVDVAGGGDYNAYSARNPHLGWIVTKNKSNDTMTNVNEIERLIKESEATDEKTGEIKKLLIAERVNVDDIGIGRGVCDRAKEKQTNVNPVTVGMPSKEPDRYANQKADYYWRARLWVLAIGKDGNKVNKLIRYDINGIPVWYQLTWIKYKVNTDKVLKIEPKDELKSRNGNKSPDFAEAFMLTFADTLPVPNFRWLD